MSDARPVRRAVHFWSEVLREPPCGALDDGGARSHELDDVTCAGCLEALAGDGGDLRAARAGPDGERPAP